MMNEKVSALADGEMQAEEASSELALILSDKAAMQAWRDYQRIGDAMRGSASLSDAFAARLMLAIEQEPTVLAPNAMPRTLYSTSAKETTVEKIHTGQKIQDRLPAAWSIAASCAAVLMVGWVLLNQQLQDFTSGQSMQVAISQSPNSQVSNSLVQQPDATKLVASPAEAPALPLEYLAAHHVSAPSVGSYYIQAASYSE